MLAISFGRVTRTLSCLMMDVSAGSSLVGCPLLVLTHLTFTTPMRNRSLPRSRRVGNAFVFFELSVVMSVRRSGSVPCFVSDSSTDVGRPATSFVAASKWRSGRAFFFSVGPPPPPGYHGLVGVGWTSTPGASNEACCCHVDTPVADHPDLPYTAVRMAAAEYLRRPDRAHKSPTLTLTQSPDYPGENTHQK